MDFFRSYLNGALKFNWQLGLFLIFLLGVPRFITVLQASKMGDYRFTSVIFVIMWLLPFLLLNRSGRKEIGIRKPHSGKGLLIGILVGILFCGLVWFIGDLLYGNSTVNWLVYISKSYTIPNSADLYEHRLMYFLIFGLTSMIFSPIGEELMYRGFIHRCFTRKFGSTGASYIDSGAFALTHLAHFGVLYTSEGWVFYPLPALLWVILMFVASRIFFFIKQRSGSILGAILSHAFFNLTMTYFIFYFIF